MKVGMAPAVQVLRRKSNQRTQKTLNSAQDPGDQPVRGSGAYTLSSKRWGTFTNQTSYFLTSGNEWRFAVEPAYFYAAFLDKPILSFIGGTLYFCRPV